MKVNRRALDLIAYEALNTVPHRLPRLAAVVATGDQVLWSGAGGKQTYHADKQPEGTVTIETPFAMFSSTKFVTCL
jgi:hypothetical protein